MAGKYSAGGEHVELERERKRGSAGVTQRREWIGGDVSDENPDSVNFPVDGFPWRKLLDAGPQGTERKRNADLDRTPTSIRLPTHSLPLEIPRRDPPCA